MPAYPGALLLPSAVKAHTGAGAARMLRHSLHTPTHAGASQACPTAHELVKHQISTHKPACTTSLRAPTCLVRHVGAPWDVCSVVVDIVSEDLGTRLYQQLSNYAPHFAAAQHQARQTIQTPQVFCSTLHVCVCVCMCASVVCWHCHGIGMGHTTLCPGCK
eukprot:1159699-Pelagomonas_calceolata.AAC.13